MASIDEFRKIRPAAPAWVDPHRRDHSAPPSANRRFEWFSDMRMPIIGAPPAGLDFQQLLSCRSRAKVTASTLDAEPNRARVDRLWFLHAPWR